MMEYPKRKETRLKEYDYSSPGYYFVTICTHERQKNVLCTITPPHHQKTTVDAVGVAALGGPPRIALTPIGQIVDRLILNIDHVYPHISVDSYVIMPDHLHLILVIHAPRHGSPRAATPTVGIPEVLNTLKGLATKRSHVKPLWQRGYHDHIIRDDFDLDLTRQYIQNNPQKLSELTRTDSKYGQEKIPR